MYSTSDSIMPCGLAMDAGRRGGGLWGSGGRAGRHSPHIGIIDAAIPV